MTTTPNDYQELLRLADLAANRAGAFIKEFIAKHPRAAIHQNADSKTSATDMVTEADRASERLIVSTLLEARPDDSFMGEEGADHQGTSDVTWVIDPIDGTTNFVYGFPSFAVSIAAVIDGQSVAGIVYNPIYEEKYTAILGGGAFLNGVALAGPTSPPRLAGALVGTGFGYSEERRADQAHLLQTILPAARDIRRAGAASLDLCYVADGRLDAYYEAGLKPWDKAAGLLVATETGATWSDLEDIVPNAMCLVVSHGDLQIELVELLMKAATA